jgi:glutathione S-transferase
VKLYYSPTSPYARKVRVFTREKGLLGQMDEVAVNPWSQDDSVAELHAVNPLGKVPALIGPTGESYFDSRVICAFLDTAGENGEGLIPHAGEERFRVLRGEALADGVADAAVGVVMESRRPAGQQSEAAKERGRMAITRGVSAMSEALPFLPRGFGIAHIAFAVSLAYLDFRLSDMGWRANHGGLAQWLDEVAARPSMTETAPPA